MFTNQFVLFRASKIRNDCLSQCQATVITRHLLMEVHDKTLLLQSISDKVKQNLVLPHPPDKATSLTLLIHGHVC